MRIYSAIRKYANIFLQKKLFKQKFFLRMQNHVCITHHSTMPGELCISKSLDDFKIQYKKKFTCLLTKCIFCNNTALFINIMTGNYSFYSKEKLNYKLIRHQVFNCFRLVHLYTLFEVW